jgi:hypothetical protein
MKSSIYESILTSVCEDPARSGWWLVKVFFDNGETWVTEVGPQTSEIIKMGVRKYALIIEDDVHKELASEGVRHLKESFDESNRWELTEK